MRFIKQKRTPFDQLHVISQSQDHFFGFLHHLARTGVSGPKIENDIILCTTNLSLNGFGELPQNEPAGKSELTWHSRAALLLLQRHPLGEIFGTADFFTMREVVLFSNAKNKGRL